MKSIYFLFTLLFFTLLGIRAFTQKQKIIFEVTQPNKELSPYTGMTRKHWVDAAKYLLSGAFSYVHSLDDPMIFPKQPGKSYPKHDWQVPTEKLEGLCRTLFIAAPLLNEDSNLTINNIRVADYYRHQISMLADSTKATYIKPRSKNGGPSQNLVEFGALSISLTYIPHILWQPLTAATKEQLSHIMLSYGDGPTVPSNWKFFNIFVLSFFKNQGYQVNEQLLKEYLNKSLEHYRGDSWYNDNPAYDYYSMWAFQTYGIIWAEKYGKKFYPNISEKFIANFRPLKDNYPYMFTQNGDMIMWGRSNSYRMGTIAPFPFVSTLNNVSEKELGWLRRISSGDLLQFLQNPNFLSQGVPTLGFYGAFEPTVQSYSCRGSVYWMGKAFLGLFLPKDNKFWTATENEGPWTNGQFKKNTVINKFADTAQILLTDYPNIGASEIRAWCDVKNIGANEPFRSSECYNRLSYNSAFPWQADSSNGTVAMNYIVLNKDKQWEPFRLYQFQSFENGIYRRDVSLETNKKVQFRLADIPLANGILRVDQYIGSENIEIKLGHYALPDLGNGIKESHQTMDGHEITIIDNGVYQLAMVPMLTWKKTEILPGENIHPQANLSKVIDVHTQLKPSENQPIYLSTLMLWKKSGEKWSKDELLPIKNFKMEKAQITINMKNRSSYTVIY